ncbi:hypothetical protein BER2_0462 [plant metagenome]|uniref:Uncharacterized protein n=1 Tax=plant metagenome TaxID=1297885 RepID=A0A484R4G7_9ZZZZ
MRATPSQPSGRHSSVGIPRSDYFFLRNTEVFSPAIPFMT